MQNRTTSLWLVLFALGGSALAAQAPVLVKDINATKNPFSTSANPSELVPAGGYFYLRAETEATGAELFRFSPPNDKPTLIKDIVPGPAGSNPRLLQPVGNGVAFVATTPATGEELFVSDGTASGTALVKDIRPGSETSYPQEFTPIPGGILFRADDGSSGRELWYSNGTAAGTKMIKDIAPGSASSNPYNLTPFGGKVLFAANYSTDLWITDGTSAGTQLLKTFPSSTSFKRFGLTVLGNRAYFTVDDGVHGRELWSTDGTTNGTTLTLDLYPGSVGSDPAFLTVFGNRLVFAATAAAATGNEPYISDGTKTGTALLRDIYIGVAPSYPGGFTTSGSLCYFTASTGFGGTDRELWRTDGTTSGTLLVADIGPNTQSGSPAWLTPLGKDGVLFTADDGKIGREPYYSNGAPGKAVLLRDIIGYSLGSNPAYFAVAGGKAYFAATASPTGRQLWVTDGTGTGTVIFHDLNPPRGTLSSNPQGVTEFFGNVIFSAFEPLTGGELYISDGTASGTRILKDINPAPYASGGAGFLTRAGNRVFFTAIYNELWTTDGTTSGTVPIHRWPNSAYGGMTALGDRIFCAGDDGVHGEELWVSDGTTAGTKMVLDIDKGIGSGVSFTSAGLPVVFRDRIWFSASDGKTGRELWSSDGTAAGTTLLVDLYPGATSSLPERLFVAGDKLYFRASTATRSGELFVTDGTASGTRAVLDNQSGPPIFSFSMPLAALQGKLLFSAKDPVNDIAIWITDGTATGTKLVKDIAKGYTSSWIKGLGFAGGYFLFSEESTAEGNELWRTDGTTAGTVLVKDIEPGPTGSYPSLAASTGSRYLYFAATTGAKDRELWRTDGTTTGTVRAADVRVGLLGSDPETVVLANGELMFVADDGDTGRELWRICPGAAGVSIARGCSASPTRVPQTTLTDPVLGSSCKLATENGAPGATALPFVGVPMIGGPFDLSVFRPGCVSGIDFNVSPVILTSFTVPASGAWNRSIAVPNDTSLLCVSIGLQTWHNLPSSGVELSNTWLFTLGR